MNKNSKIYVAGGQSGLVGTAIVRALKKKGFKKIIVKKRSELDLINQDQVKKFFENERPEYVFIAAAKVGGILANQNKKAEFIYENLQIQNNLIFNAWKYRVKKLLFLGSSCIYPKFSLQPIKEDFLLTGSLEETNNAYAVAKIAGITMCQSFNIQYKTNFISVMPTNSYGPNDNFNLQYSHVLPALIRKFHEAKIKKKKRIILWGTGKAYREFLYVDDLADACIFLMNNYNASKIINIGTGKDLTIYDLAVLVKNITKFKGKIVWDNIKPDGMPRKLLDVGRLNKLGWRPKTSLIQGIKKTYQWFLKNYEFINKNRR